MNARLRIPREEYVEMLEEHYPLFKFDINKADTYKAMTNDERPIYEVKMWPVINLNIKEYQSMINEKLDKAKFDNYKIGKYKKEEDFYEVEKETEFTYRMIASFEDFTEEQQKENFIKVAATTINGFVQEQNTKNNKKGAKAKK